MRIIQILGMFSLIALSGCGVKPGEPGGRVNRPSSDAEEIQAPLLLGLRAQSSTEIELTWKIPASTKAKIFVVSIGKPNGSFSEKARLVNSDLSAVSLSNEDLQYTWIDSTGLEPAHDYDYKLSVGTSSGFSDNSNVVGTRTLATDPLPTAPSGQNLTNISSHVSFDCRFCEFDLNWNWPSNYPSGTGITFDIAAGFKGYATTKNVPNLNVTTTHIEISDCDAGYNPVSNEWMFAITPKRMGAPGPSTQFGINFGNSECAIAP